MNTLIKSLTLITLLFAANHHLQANSLETFKKFEGELSEAIDSQNFKEAKHALYELLPLMEEDLKYSKKLLAIKKKEKATEELTDIKKKLEMKKEIFKQIDHLLHSSPAALRVKSKDALSLIGKFRRLSNWPKTT